jgi:hypothetical protein
VQRFLDTTGTRVFRRPLVMDELGHYKALFTQARAAGASFAEGAAALVQAMLVAPPFLFVLEPSGMAGARPLDSWQIATRLSLLLWQTTPDPMLIAAAARDELRSKAQIDAHVQRMLADKRARPVIAGFFEDWLGFDDIEKVQKDTKKYPDATSSMLRTLANETRMFIDDAFWNQGADFGKLLVSPTRIRSAALSKFYKDGLSAEMKETPVQAAVGDKSFGLLSQAGFLMAISRNDDDAIIYRGKFLRTRLLCGQISPPPPGIASPLPMFKPGMTGRQRVETHTSGAACVVCHNQLNPLGYALEFFGGDGRWRDNDGGLAIDATTEIAGSDITAKVNGALDLSQKLAASGTVQRCVVSQVMEYALGRRPGDGDRCIADGLQKNFAGKPDIKQLIADIAQSDAFSARVEPKE